MMTKPPYDMGEHATGVVNELFYRDGPEPKAIEPKDAMYVREVIEQALIEAYEAGLSEPGKLSG